MRITRDEARAFFAHPSQQLGGLSPDNLPDVEYWADGGICGAFHLALWPGVWMAHYGVKPDHWGRLDAPAKRVLTEFWQARQPQRIIGWTLASNRHALAFAKRIGFTIDGTMPLQGDALIMQGWTCSEPF